jgi:type IV secretory pathway TrbF-like protein
MRFRPKTQASTDQVPDGPVTDKTYMVLWRERTYTMSGEQSHTQEFKGLFTYAFTPPAEDDLKEWEVNAFGLLITEMDVNPVKQDEEAK